jgi:hypothetical protein
MNIIWDNSLRQFNSSYCFFGLGVFLVYGLVWVGNSFLNTRSHINDTLSKGA